MATIPPEERPDHLPSLGEGPLVPLLPADEDPADPVTRSTWHQAISATLAPEIPHDLLGFWLYPVSGGSVLLGPEELAADHLNVPEPPAISLHQLGLLEEIVRNAGYHSTTAVVASVSGVDVGLLLFAALGDALHGPRERAAAQLAADALAPSLARLARRWREGDAPAPRSDRDLLDLMGAVNSAAVEAGSPIELRERLSTSLQPLLPHDRAELMVPGTTLDQWYRIGLHGGGSLWGDPDLVVHRGQVDLAGLLGSADSFVLHGLPGEPVAFPPVSGAPAMRSVVGVRLTVANRTVGLLMLGSSHDRQYDEEDAKLLRSMRGAVAARLDSYLLAGHLQVLRSHVASQRTTTSRLARIVEALASAKDPADATLRVQSEAAGMLGFEEMSIALKLGDELRVALFHPGERRPLPDLPQQALGDDALGQVLRGERRSALEDARGRTRLIVPLRVQGRLSGALIFTTSGEGMFGGSDEDVARQLADALAPHLELLRRVAITPPMPGWKRSPRQP